MVLKDERGEIKTECEELLKIMESALKEQFYTNQKQENEEQITKEEWERGHQQRSLTKERMGIETEREKAPLTKYIKPKDQPAKRYLIALITEAEVKKK